FDPVARTLHGMPGNEHVGSVDITLTAMDRLGETVSQTFSLIIHNVNDAPTLDKPFEDQVIIKGVLFEFIVPEESFADVDAGDVLSYTATLADGSALPDWLTFDAVTRTFSGTPPDGAAVELAIVVVATDRDGAQAT